MRLLANLLVMVSLVAGLFGAATAYLPSLSLPDQRLVGLTLNAPAGIGADPAGRPQPLAIKNARLTPELLATLRAAGVRRVRVKEFALARWDGAWLFLAGCAGLALGAGLLRASAKKALTAGPASGGAPGQTPEAVLAAMRRAVDGLRAELPRLPDVEERLRRVLDVLTEVQEKLVPDFAALRPVLTARLGLAGYARLMDRFAAGERQINRAWSAAADGIEEEVIDCLERAALLLAETMAALEGAATPKRG
jgi:hypothetical protein